MGEPIQKGGDEGLILKELSPLGEALDV